MKLAKKKTELTLPYRANIDGVSPAVEMTNRTNLKRLPQ